MMREKKAKTVLVTGSAGFIGSHLVDHLLDQGHTVAGVDNLSRGRRENLSSALHNPNFHFFELDVNDAAGLRKVFAQFAINEVWHMVANSDIFAGVQDASVDLRDTFLSTYNVLQAMREAGVRRLVFPSTSAVYGVHSGALRESTGPLLPISNYGAMKLASEGAISAAAESYLDCAWVFRLPNVIGPRVTHGVLFDLFTRLKGDPSALQVLGDGEQRKPYLHVSELIEAMDWIVAHAHERINCFNIGPEDQGIAVRDIAQTIIDIASPSTPVQFTGGSRGWVGDVPSFHYSIEKAKALGWAPRTGSREAILRAAREIHREMFADAPATPLR